MTAKTLITTMRCIATIACGLIAGGCAPKEPLTQESYENALKIEATADGESVVVKTIGRNWGPKIFEQRVVHLVPTAGRAVTLDETSGSGGMPAIEMTLPSVFPGGFAALKAVKVSYVVWDGEPKTGRMLFKGSKEINVPD